MSCTKSNLKVRREEESARGQKRESTSTLTSEFASNIQILTSELRRGRQEVQRTGGSTHIDIGASSQPGVNWTGRRGNIILDKIDEPHRDLHIPP